MKLAQRMQTLPLKPLRVEMRLKNNVLVSLRERAKLGIHELAKLAGVGAQTYHGLELLRVKPISRKTGDWSPSAYKIADYYRLPVEALFPDDVLAVERRTAKLALNVADVGHLMLASQPLDPEAALERKEELQMLTAALTGDEVYALEKALSPFERSIVRKHFGLDDGVEQTFKEIGDTYNLSRERTRQIHEGGLGKMRRALVAATTYSEPWRPPPPDPVIEEQNARRREVREQEAEKRSRSAKEAHARRAEQPPEFVRRTFAGGFFLEFRCDPLYGRFTLRVELRFKPFDLVELAEVFSQLGVPGGCGACWDGNAWTLEWAHHGVEYDVHYLAVQPTPLRVELGPHKLLFIFAATP